MSQNQNTFKDEIQFCKAKKHTPRWQYHLNLFHKKAKYEKTDVMKSILSDYLAKSKTAK
jgi:hypothetical protein